MKDFLIKSLITVIMLAVISLVFILAETLPIISFIITVILSLFVIGGIIYEIIGFMDKKEIGKKGNDLID